MIKIISSLLSFLFLFSNIYGQKKPFTISIDEDEIKGGNIMGYYHSQGNTNVINTQKKDSITHLFYDNAFNFVSQYKVDGSDRRLLYAVYGSGHKKPYFIKNISIQNTIIEIYGSRDSVFIYQLDHENRSDIRLTGIDLNKKYKDEILLAVMPNDKGCNFLSASQKKDVIVIYKWLFAGNTITSFEIPFLKSTLSDEEKKKWGGDFLELKDKAIFSSMSVSNVNKPDVFQFPSLSQLFYNENYIYIVNAIPKRMGTNVLTINSNTGIISSKNYIVNKLPSETDLNDEAFPVATIFDSILIIQNWSEKRFEYYFYSLSAGELIKKYNVKNGDSIYKFIHSPLRQFGTFGSSKQEKQTGNERRFVRKMEHGVRFIKPMLLQDSIVFTIGSFAPTKGAEGLFMGLAAVGTGLALASAGTNAYFFFYNTERNKFLFAHSKFSVKDFEPSNGHDLTTFLDDFISNKQMDELKDDNSILIAKPGKLYIGIYARKSRIVTFTEFDQH